VWWDLNDFQTLMIDVWHDMDNYAILLQPLFKLFKQSLGGYINLKHMDMLAEVFFSFNLDLQVVNQV
jgi:hypothetical protein